MPRNCVYLTVFNTIMSLNWCWGGEVRRTSIHIKKSSNLPDDKNDFPYVLFLIKELLFFIDTKCVIYLFVLRRSSWSYLSFILVGRRFHRNIPTLNGDHKWQKKIFFARNGLKIFFYKFQTNANKRQKNFFWPL